MYGKDVNRTGSLVVLMLGTSMAGIDSSIVNISLPVMRTQFSSELTEVQWVVTAYMLSYSIFIPLTDWLKNRIGLFNLYVASTVVFTIGSLLCGLSTGLNWLVAARVLQAAGSGAITPSALAIISQLYPKEQSGRATSIWGLGTVMGPALGPTIGGVLTQHFGWPSIFFINLPVGIITVLLAFKYLRFLRHTPTIPEPFHTKGFVFLALSIAGLQYFIILLQHPAGNRVALALLAVLVVISLLLFYRACSKTPFPLLDLTLFANLQFVNSLGLNAIRSIALYGGLFILPFLLQGGMGLSETASGIVMMAGALMVGIVMPFSGRWSDKHGYRGISIVGLLTLCMSMIIFSFAEHGSDLHNILMAILLRGLSLGLLNSPLTAAVIGAVQTEKVAMASSINTLVQQISGAFGVSLFSLIHQAHNLRYKAAGLPAAIAEQHSLRDCFLIAALLLGIGILPALKLPAKGAKRRHHSVLIHSAPSH